MEREHIFIAIPTTDVQVTIGIAALCQTAERLCWSTDSKYKFTVQYVNGRRPVEFARNSLVGRFLASGADRLWFLDADMLPPKNAFDLLEIEGDLVSALCPAMSPTPKMDTSHITYCFYEKAEEGTFRPMEIPEGPNPFDVDAVGSASVLIRRAVFLHSDMALAEPIMSKGEPVPCFYRTGYKDNGEPLYGEDINFSWRAKAAGFSVVAVPSIRFGHRKSIDVVRVVEMLSIAFDLGAKHGLSDESLIVTPDSAVN